MSPKFDVNYKEIKLIHFNTTIITLGAAVLLFLYDNDLNFGKWLCKIKQK